MHLIGTFLHLAIFVVILYKASSQRLLVSHSTQNQVTRDSNGNNHKDGVRRDAPPIYDMKKFSQYPSPNIFDFFSRLKKRYS